MGLASFLTSKYSGGQAEIRGGEESQGGCPTRTSVADESAWKQLLTDKWHRWTEAS